MQMPTSAKWITSQTFCTQTEINRKITLLIIKFPNLSIAQDYDDATPSSHDCSSLPETKINKTIIKRFFKLIIVKSIVKSSILFY